MLCWKLRRLKVLLLQRKLLKLQKRRPTPKLGKQKPNLRKLKLKPKLGLQCPPRWSLLILRKKRQCRLHLKRSKTLDHYLNDDLIRHYGCLYSESQKPSDIRLMVFDEDITSIHTMNGPITRSRARQLNLQVRSTLVNYVLELMLGAMDVLMNRYLGEDQQGLGKGQGVEEEQQGRPQQEGDQV
jgi:hypothetical protein